MRTETWLHQATAKLNKAGIATARLDCLVMLEDALGQDRSYLLAHPETPCQGRTLTRLNGWVGRRARHEPLAYIRGKTEFYGREFLVNPHTLEPRPETETMVELLKQLADSRQLTADSFHVVDVGTGSGAIAITIKLEMPDAKVIAIDISAECLKIARKNAKKHSVDITFLKADLLRPIPSSIFHLPTSTFAILANLPYVPDSHTVNEAAMYEPKLAIFGGSDGLDLYRKLFLQIDSLVVKPRFILTESLPFQHESLAQIAQQHGYDLRKINDFIQVYELFNIN